jgi:hypothetical protein
VWFRNDDHRLVRALDNFSAVDFVGYLKQYALTSDNDNEAKARHDRRRTNANTLTPADVFNAIGTSPVSCLITLGHLSQRIEKVEQSTGSLNAIERMFLFKLNADGQFTYFDQM